MNDQDFPGLHERALVIAVEARTLAQTAHERQDSMEAQITAIRTELSDFKESVSRDFTVLKEAVARLNTKAGLAAAVGAALASGVVGLLLHFFH